MRKIIRTGQLFFILILFTLVFSTCSNSTQTEVSPTETQPVIGPTLTPTKTKIPTYPPAPTRTPKPTLTPTQTPIPVSSIRVGDVEILRSSIMTFSLDGNIWVVDHGEFRQLTYSGKDSYPKLTYDGQYVVFIRSTWKEHDREVETCKNLGLDDLMMIRSVGSGEQVLVSAKDILSFYQNLFTNDHEVYSGQCGIGIESFSLEALESSGVVLFSSSTDSWYWFLNDLFSINFQTKKISHLVQPYEGGAYSISPDGNWIASAGAWDAGLDLIDLQSYQVYTDILEYEMFYPFILETPEFPTIQWSSDSKSFYVVTGYGDFTEPFNNYNSIWKVTLDEFDVEMIADIEISSMTEFLLIGVVSPDGNTVIISCPGETQEDLGLCTSEIDGSELNVITKDLGLRDYFNTVTWSPTGEVVLFYNKFAFYREENSYTKFGLEIEFDVYGDEVFWLSDTLFLVSDPYPGLKSQTFLVNLETREAFLVEDIFSLSDILLLDQE